MLLFKTFNDKSIKISSNENNVSQKNVLKIMSSKTIMNDEKKMNDVMYYNDENENMKFKKNRMNINNDAKIIFSSNNENEKKIDVKQIKVDDVITTRK